MLRHVQQPIQTQTNPSKLGFSFGQKVQHVRQSVRVHASFGHALAHPQTGSQLRHLRQTILETVASSGTSAFSHWRKALRMRALRQSVRRQVSSTAVTLQPSLECAGKLSDRT